jgi:hypothetical protein
MSYTSDQHLELIISGGADWDTSINHNMMILDRGYHVITYAAADISSGQVLSIGSGGTVAPMDAKSLDNFPALLGHWPVSSGAIGQFVAMGSVRSMGVWSGHIVPGQPAFVAVDSPGFCVASFAGHGPAIGLAISTDCILFHPGHPQVFPELVTSVFSTAATETGTYADFTMLVGNRGLVRDLTVVSSHNRFKVQFWSGSSRVASEALYETLTRSLSTASGDVASTYFRDAAGFPFRVTEATTPYHIYGRITPQTGSGVNSAAFGVTIIAERFR